MTSIKDLITWPKQTRESYLSPISLSNRFNDIFENTFLDSHFPSNFGLINRFPFVNVTEDKSNIFIKAELPSMSQDDIKININKNSLTISGEKRSETQKEGNVYHISELLYGKFSRTINLPFDIDENKTKASFANGVLSITIQKPAEAIKESKFIPIT